MKNLVVPYKGSLAVDAASFYCPYVPLQSSSASNAYYWKAVGLYEDCNPADLTEVDGLPPADRMDYEWPLLVKIEGHFRWDDYGDLHNSIHRWAEKSGTRIIIDIDYPDVVLFHDIESAVLFLLTFSSPTYFKT